MRYWIAGLLVACLVTIADWAARASYDEAVDAIGAGDYSRAIELLTPLAEGGDPNAQFTLAFIYDYGQGVPEDPELAADWYTQAARSGLPVAQFTLAGMYETGRGVERDLARAFAWYDRAVQRLASGPTRNSVIESRDNVAARLTPENLERARALAAEPLEPMPPTLPPMAESESAAAEPLKTDPASPPSSPDEEVWLVPEPDPESEAVPEDELADDSAPSAPDEDDYVWPGPQVAETPPAVDESPMSPDEEAYEIIDAESELEDLPLAETESEPEPEREPEPEPEPVPAESAEAAAPADVEAESVAESPEEEESTSEPESESTEDASAADGTAEAQTEIPVPQEAETPAVESEAPPAEPPMPRTRPAAPDPAPGAAAAVTAEPPPAVEAPSTVSLADVISPQTAERTPPGATATETGTARPEPQPLLSPYAEESMTILRLRRGLLDEIAVELSTPNAAAAGWQRLESWEVETRRLLGGRIGGDRVVRFDRAGQDSIRAGDPFGNVTRSVEAYRSLLDEILEDIEADPAAYASAP